MFDFEALVMEIDPVNAEYILKDRELQEDVKRLESLLESCIEDEKYALVINYHKERIENKVRKYDSKKLVPTNAKVGDGATVNYWTDRHAATIIKVTAKSITVQRDKATLKPEFKPERVAGGFAGVVINQNDQDYTYERDENGQKITFYWSEKYQRYGQPNNLSLSKGRHEFYDYNF